VKLLRILDNDLRRRLIDAQSAMALLEEDLTALRDPVTDSTAPGK
jgi:hypothetical protein